MQYFGTINEILLKEVVTDYLKMKGIKFKLPKKPKDGKPIQYGQQLFQVPLSKLKLARVDVNDGINFLRIPEFLVNACSLIEREIHVEGIFRKAGSITKQKEIKRQLNSGNDLPSGTHVIDTCNLVKLFLRELPEPILPHYYHDLFLNCLLLQTEEQQAEVALISCLLLPRDNIAVLMYFLRFLLRVAEFNDRNKMSIKNLSIVLAPSLMPVKESVKNLRNFNVDHHISLIELLIKHAHEVGLVPDFLIPKLTTNGSSCNTNGEVKRRKSGSSIVRVLTGIRRMVQSTKPIVESDITPNRKRRSYEPNTDSSAKRRKELEIEENGITATSSVGLNRMASYSQSSAGWTVTRNKLTHSTTSIFRNLRSSKSLNALNNAGGNDSINDMKPEPVAILASDLITIPRSEYNEMKRRVSDMDQLLQQLHGDLVIPIEENNETNGDSVTNAMFEEEKMDWIDANEVFKSDGNPEMHRITENENIGPSKTSKSQSSKQPLRTRSSERVIRSPSQRKIGSIRRRSQELARSLSMQQPDRRDSIVSLRRTNLGKVMETASYFDTLQKSNTSSVGSPGPVTRNAFRKAPPIKPNLLDVNVASKTPIRRNPITPRRKPTPLRAFSNVLTPHGNAQKRHIT